jgi:hypothetical protein
MGMTTMLTLASIFGSLTNVTPPISYTTRLDIWMISCLTFVFGTLAEFTLVIILKYYLPHLPLGCFHKLCLKARSAPRSSVGPKSGISKRPSSVNIDRTNAWVSNQANIRQRTATPVVERLTQDRNGVNDQQTMGNERIFDDDDESILEEVLLDERKQMAEKVIKVIDKYSVIFFFISFSIFVGIYWYQLLHCFYGR